MPHNAPESSAAGPSGDVPDIRSLQRSYSNLSQATTLVGSESDDDDNVEQPVRTSGDPSEPHHRNGEGRHGGSPREEADVDAGENRSPTMVIRRTHYGPAMRVYERMVSSTPQRESSAPERKASDHEAMKQEAQGLSDVGQWEKADRLYSPIFERMRG